MPYRYLFGRRSVQRRVAVPRNDGHARNLFGRELKLVGNYNA